MQNFGFKVIFNRTSSVQDSFNWTYHIGEYTTSYYHNYNSKCFFLIVNWCNITISNCNHSCKSPIQSTNISDCIITIWYIQNHIRIWNWILTILTFILSSLEPVIFIWRIVSYSIKTTSNEMTNKNYNK